MHERRTPRIAHDLWAEDHVAELPRKAVRRRRASVDRKREGVRLLVDAEVLAFQGADLLGSDERESELPLGDALGAEHLANQIGRSSNVELRSRPIRYLYFDHARYFRRCVPVSSACSLYAST